MGSIIDYIECPHCKQPDCYLDYYYKTAEEYIFCNQCGYSASITIDRDENGNIKYLNPTKAHTLENVTLVENITIPYGLITINSKDESVAAHYSVKDVTECDELLNTIKKDKSNIKSVILSRFVNGIIEKTDMTI